MVERAILEHELNDVPNRRQLVTRHIYPHPFPAPVTRKYRADREADGTERPYSQSKLVTAENPIMRRQQLSNKRMTSGLASAGGGRDSGGLTAAVRPTTIVE